MRFRSRQANHHHAQGVLGQFAYGAPLHPLIGLVVEVQADKPMKAGPQDLRYGFGIFEVFTQKFIFDDLGNSDNQGKRCGEEIESRKNAADNVEIIKKLELGCVIEYDKGRQLPSYGRKRINVKVGIMSDSRSKYNDDLDQNIEITEYKELENLVLLSTDDFPPINSEVKATRITNWEASDWDDQLFATGTQELVVWHQEFPKNVQIGVGTDF